MNATMRFMVWGPMPIGALVGGALGGAIGLRPTLWVSALAGLLSPLWVIFSPVRHQREIPGDGIAEQTIEPSPVGPLRRARRRRAVGGCRAAAAAALSCARRPA